MPGALPGKWPRLPGMGPLGGIDGYFACAVVAAHGPSREKPHCCLPDPVSPTKPAFLPPEVNLRATEELFELECLFTGDDAKAKHFRRHAHLFNSAHAYASLKRVAKQKPLPGPMKASIIHLQSLLLKT